ncbi:GNAT family N-acetyltransferase [Bacillus sp. T33-2]|uniref:GNAT family N-acetyltransferase n=1 Tax=Bacillus sp. T33-2 TaxID=2054168 RepID=UPI000C762B1E|nr:GNAT family N-acetyltransferase [Bacillus sp. T33-2]PLR99819.1 GNAT family N-acetyltransferase [Bacillus sp. T33-2]
MKPVLVEFPERIETERLYIRPCRPGDGNVVHDAIEASRQELLKWLPFAQVSRPAEEVEAGIREAYAKFIMREDFRLNIYRKDGDAFVGSTGLHRIDWDVRKFEIGYWCDSRHQKNGYITETVETLTKFAFDHLAANRVEIRCDPNNTASRRIAEKLGFNLEGILRNNSLTADGTALRDTCIFAKVTEK